MEKEAATRSLQTNLLPQPMQRNVGSGVSIHFELTLLMRQESPGYPKDIERLRIAASEERSFEIRTGPTGVILKRSPGGC